MIVSKRKNIKKKKKKKGFTLIELLAVIVILSVLMVVAVPGVRAVITTTKKNTYMSTVKTYFSAAEQLIAAEGVEEDSDVKYCIPITALTKDGIRDKDPMHPDMELYGRVLYDIKDYVPDDETTSAYSIQLVSGKDLVWDGENEVTGTFASEYIDYLSYNPNIGRADIANGINKTNPGKPLGIKKNIASECRDWQHHSETSSTIWISWSGLRNNGYGYRPYKEEPKGSRTVYTVLE